MSVFLVIFGFATAQQNAYYQQHAKYQMQIDVDVANFTYHGTQQIEYTNNSPDELSVVYFHLYWNAFKPNSMMDQRVQNQGENADRRLVTMIDGKLSSRLSQIPKNEEGNQQINWIKQNGKILKTELQETILKVYLNEPIKANSTTQFSMDWDATIPKQIRRSGRNNKEGVDMTMTQWFPKIAEYDYDGWATFDYVGREFHAPFSDFDVIIKMDKNYVIGAGGTLENPNEVKGYSEKSNIKSDQNSKATWHFTAKNMLDFAWAADRDYSVEKFTVLDGPEVFLVYQKSDKTKFWAETKPYITKYFQLMNAKFGRYVYPSYAFIQGGDGGMEYGMCTMVLGEAKALQDLCGLMFHEGSHSWYQQMLATNESMKPWLDEGFTSYAESYVMNQLFPPAEALPNPFINSITNYQNFVKSGKEEPAVWLGDHHDNGSAYSVASYTKGELYLVQLGYIVGEDNLSKILKKYYEDWHLKHPTDRDFLHIAQQISGMDLKWFHHYWISTTKTIDYAIKNTQFLDNSTIITLENKGQIPMPIDFSVLTKDNKVITYHIPMNMTHTLKEKDIYGNFITLPYWNWTAKEYQITVPYKKSEIAVLGIDFSQRLADVNPENNFLEVK